MEGNHESQVEKKVEARKAGRQKEYFIESEECRKLDSDEKEILKERFIEFLAANNY